MGRNKITIEDIAREANVGIGTVSRVLNNSAHVAEETRKRVLDVVKARQYTPSAAASKLARNDAVETTVGLLLPDIGNHYFFEIFESIYRKFRGLGIDLLIFNYEKHNPKVIRRVLDAQLSALLIFAFQLDDTERDMLKQRNVRYLYIDYPREGEHCIYTDNIHGGRLAARYLLEKGVRNPCYIAVEPPAQANEDRYRGFTQELSLHGYTDCATFHAGLSEDSGYEAARMIISEGRYDGIFCYCDDIATGAIRAIRESGAPIRIVGFDGVRTSAYLGLSTISQEPQAIGTFAASLIVEIMREREDPPPVSHRIVPSLCDRDS